MKRNREFRERDGGRSGDLPKRTQDLDSFRQNIPYPSGTEEDFARHHAELYTDEEGLVDGNHTRTPHFPGGTERARIHLDYTSSNRHRDKTRRDYDEEFDSASAEYSELSREQDRYYYHTSGGMLPRHHTNLLPLARAREAPSHHNAINRERLLTNHYEYHSLGGQQAHWKYAESAYEENRKAQDDYARHQRYRSDPNDANTKDCYMNSPVHDTRPHTRSRNYGIPPPGTYCDRLNTPPGDDDGDGDGDGYH